MAEAGGAWNPWGYASLGSLSDQSGSILIDTSTYGSAMILPNGTILNGVLDPTGQVAVFDFSSVNLSSDSVVVQGSLPWRILSLGIICHLVHHQCLCLEACLEFSLCYYDTLGYSGRSTSSRSLSRLVATADKVGHRQVAFEYQSPPASLCS